jgi:hypothetical protein
MLVKLDRRTLNRGGGAAGHIGRFAARVFGERRKSTGILLYL